VQGKIKEAQGNTDARLEAATRQAIQKVQEEMEDKNLTNDEATERCAATTEPQYR
jgi:hypothetical protein